MTHAPSTDPAQEYYYVTTPRALLEPLRAAINRLPERVRPVHPPSQATSARQTSSATGPAHPTPSNVQLPAAPGGFPSLAEQQGTVCPNCHRGTERSLRDQFTGFGTGPGGELTPEDRKRILEFLQSHK